MKEKLKKYGKRIECIVCFSSKIETDPPLTIEECALTTLSSTLLLESLYGKSFSHLIKHHVCDEHQKLIKAGMSAFLKQEVKLKMFKTSD